MLNGQLRIDYDDLMSEFIGGEHGLAENALDALAPQMAQVHTQIWERSGKGSDFLGFLDLPFQDEAAIDAIQACADEIAASSDLHVVLGIGGSYLGAKALISALCHPYHNELPRARRKNRPRVYFDGNNLDSDSLTALIDLLPQERPASLDETWTLNVISKSGGTLETAVAFRIMRQLAEKQYGEDAAKRIIATTDASKGQLHDLAVAQGYRRFVVPDDVGGRYSVLTPVGLLPAAVAGVDIREVLRGAREMAELCKRDNLRENPAYLYAALQHLSYKAGRGVSVMNIWDKALEFVGFWYDQLCAESIGKEDQGRVPLTGVCTRDLHSRGQELQQGPRNTVVTNLLVGASDHDLQLQNDPADSDGLNYLLGTSVHEMLGNAAAGTNFAYASDSRPTLDIVLAKRSPYALGALFYMLEVATVAEGYLMGINPLDQPGVESYKNFMFGLLGRKDKQSYKDEFARRPPRQEKYSL